MTASSNPTLQFLGAAGTVTGGAIWLIALLPVLAMAGLVEIRVDFGVEPLLLMAFAGIVPE